MSRERFERLFRGSEDWYGQYEAGPGGEKINAYTKAGPIPDEAWDRHLAGEKTGLGIVPISDAGTCYWGCIDLDDDETDHAALIQEVGGLGLPFVICRSKSGGAHLFLFFIEPIKPVHLLAKMKRWSELLGLGNPADDQGRAAPLEFFPKQISLAAGQKGNWLNLPYFGGDATTRYGVDEHGEVMSLEAFLDHAESMRLTENELDVRQVQLGVDHDAFFLDGQPCLATLHRTGFAEGTRNAGLHNIGIFLKLKFPDSWPEVLADYNENSGKIYPPLPADEVENIVRSLTRSDYVYKCNDAPIETICEKSLCKKREYGIQRFSRDAAMSAFPVLGRLVSFENGRDDPLYELELGGKRMTLTPDELGSMMLFKRTAFRKTKVQVPQLKNVDWDQKVRDLMASHIIVQVPDDAGPLGQFLARLMEFLMLRKKSDRDEDLLDNKPWEHQGRVYFRSLALIEFLENRRAKDMNSVGIWSVIRREGGGFTTLKIGGADLAVWWMPTPTKEQTEDFKERGHDGPDF